MYRFVAALKAQSALAFKDTLRTIDLLLIDDMQFLHGKQVQQEFCHTLNALIDGARQVVVAADRPPSDLETLDDRMRSRLAGGLVAAISEPDYGLRRAILTGRVDTVRRAHPSFAIPESVLDYVARNVGTSGRDLEGALNRLIAHNQLTNQPVTQEMAEATLRDLVRNTEPRRVKIEDIQRVVSKHYSVSKADLSVGPPHTDHRSSASDRHVSRQDDDPALPAGNRASFRQPRSHHRLARRSQDRGPQPQRQHARAGNRSAEAHARRLTPGKI
jgi:chromosomal replication initiator protein